MICIALIGTLAGIAVPNYISYREKALQARAASEILSISAFIDYFYTNNRRFPNSLAEASITITLDPWGTPYQSIPESMAATLPRENCAKTILWFQ
jgi:Tfp pilus assembly protein PilE